MLSRGMFLDGLIYGDLSRNMVYSEMWTLNISSYGIDNFFDHPPLMFWIQGLFFKLFGDHFWTEHLYSLTMFFALLVVSRLFLKNILNYHKTNSFLLFAILMLLAPIMGWSFANNMLENTTIVLTLLSSYFILKTIEGRRRLIVNAFFASLFLALGFLTKGPVCLFPISIPLFHFILYPKQRKASLKSALIVLFFLLIFTIILFLYTESSVFLEKYLAQQILAALNGERPEFSENRFRILKCLLNNSMPFIGLALLFGIIRFKNLKKLNKRSLLFSLIALGGSLPLLLTQKQACIYIMPIIPYLAMSILPLVWNEMQAFLKKIDTRNIRLLIVLLGITLSMFLSQDRQRFKNLDEDSKIISQFVPKGADLNIVGLCDNYEILAYFTRYNIAKGKCELRDSYVLTNNLTENCDKIADLSVGILCFCIK